MQKITKTSFIEAVSSVCVTREIFLRLKNQSILRTLLHIVFLAFLCSLFIMLAGHDAMLKKIEKPLDAFENATGGIIYSKGGVYPAKEAAKAFEVMLSPRMKLVYSPDFKSFQANWVNKDGTTMLWFPNFWCITMTAQGHSMIKTYSGYPDSSMQDISEHEDRDDLMEYLAKRDKKSREDVRKKDLRSWDVNRIEIERVYLGGLFFYFWFEFVLQTLFMTGLFAVFYRFVGARNTTKLTFKEIFCSGIYSAVPAMIIASFFPAFNLPFFRFETVLMISILIYFIAVLNFLEHASHSENSDLQQGD